MSEQNKDARFVISYTYFTNEDYVLSAYQYLHRPVKKKKKTFRYGCSLCNHWNKKGQHVKPE